jgi:hypothetical protein
MNSIILIGILIFVALIILGIHTGEKEQARVLLERLNEEQQEDKEDLDETIEGFGPSVANLGDVSSGSSTLYNWGNSDIQDPSPHTSQEENCGTSNENTPAAAANNSKTVINNYIKNKCPSKCPDNQKTCRDCDIILNKDIDKYVLKSSVPPCPDMSKFASKNMVCPQVDMDKYILKSEVPSCPKINMSKYILKKDIPACPNCPKCPECPKCPKQEKCKKLYEYNITQHPEFNKYVSKEDCNTSTVETTLTGEEQSSSSTLSESSVPGLGAESVNTTSLTSAPLMETIPNSGGFATFTQCTPFSG